MEGKGRGGMEMLSLRQTEGRGSEATSSKFAKTKSKNKMKGELGRIDGDRKSVAQDYKSEICEILANPAISYPQEEELWSSNIPFRLCFQENKF